MKAWQQKVINQTIKILILPLPEDYRACIRDYRDQLRTKGYPNSEILILLLKDIKGFWYGLIQESIPDLLKDLSQRIDPNYWTHRIYKPYGYEAIEKIKNEFQEDFYKINLRSMQVSSIALIIFHVFLAVLDIWCLPDTQNTAWLIKLFVLTILSISAFLTFKPEQFKKYNQQIIIASLSTTALGFILTMSLSDFKEFGQYTYYGALMLLIFYMNLGASLSFFSTLIASTIILLEYLIVNYFVNPITLDTTSKSLTYFNNNAFLLISLVIGVIATNLFEHNIRLNFLIRFAIATQFKEFINYFECHNIETFFDYIKNIRHSPQILRKFVVQTFDKSLVFKFLPSNQNNPKLLINSKNRTSEQLKQNRDSDHQNNESTPKSKYDFITRTNFFRDFTNYLFTKIENINLSYKDKETENKFLSDYFYGSLTNIRLTTIFGIINYGGFVIIDKICLPETHLISDYMRLTFCLLCVLAFGVTFLEKFFEKNYQLIIMILTSLSAIGIICMAVFSKPTEMGYTTYYAGLIHVMFYIFTFSRLLFANALLVGGLMAANYGLAAICFQNVITSPEKISLFLNNLFFLIICCVVGSISCHLMEKNAREEFTTRYFISKKSKELLELNKTYNPSPQEFLDMINQIRHNPQELKKFLEQNLKRS